MTPHIQQHVVPRNRSTAGSVLNKVSLLHTAKRAHTTRWAARTINAQRGSVDHTTVSIGFGIMAILVVGILGFVYLKQVVNTASRGTDVHELEKRISEMNERQRELELEGAQLRSLQTVEGRVKKLNLVATDRVTYLAPASGSAVALAE